MGCSWDSSNHERVRLGTEKVLYATGLLVTSVTYYYYQFHFTDEETEAEDFIRLHC